MQFILHMMSLNVHLTDIEFMLRLYGITLPKIEVLVLGKALIEHIFHIKKVFGKNHLLV